MPSLFLSIFWKTKQKALYRIWWSPFQSLLSCFLAGAHFIHCINQLCPENESCLSLARQLQLGPDYNTLTPVSFLKSKDLLWTLITSLLAYSASSVDSLLPCPSGRTVGTRGSDSGLLLAVQAREDSLFPSAKWKVGLEWALIFSDTLPLDNFFLKCPNDHTTPWVKDQQ